jgi:hypothetical protein
MLRLVLLSLSSLLSQSTVSQIGEEQTLAGLSIRGYARHRGVSHTAVRKALAAGRITPSPDGTIDPMAADEQWATSTNLSKPRNSVTGVPKKRRAPGAPPDPLGVPRLEDGVASPSGEGGAPRLVSSYAASRAAREAYLARLAKLDFEERSRKLVDADQVRAQIYGLGRRLRDAFLGMPDRIAPLLVGQADQAEVHRLLTQEIMICLAELSASPPLPTVTKLQSQP